MNKKRIFLIAAVITAFLLCVPVTVNAAQKQGFLGNGTEKDPYLINDFEDISRLRDNVNNGEEYKGKYFLQTTNIDMQNKDWTPIGKYGNDNYFYGIYDGGGHYIKDLVVTGDKKKKEGNVGFFGALGGAVFNFGIESGTVSGNCCGAITSHSIGDSAAIVNCYSKADVSGTRAGGLADNFGGGSIVNSWSTGKTIGSEASAGIASYEAKEIICTYSVSDAVNENFDGESEGINILTISDMSTKKLSDLLNANILKAARYIKAPLLQYWKFNNGNTEFANKYVDLNSYLKFDGKGTEEDPYIIKNIDEWHIYNELTNAGLDTDKIVFEKAEGIVPLKGSGTKDAPYLINDLSELKWFRDTVNRGIDFTDNYFLLKSDIDLAGEEWTPIGADSTGNYFYGTFNGGGKTIKNLLVSNIYGKRSSNGFFGVLGGSVVNLGIESGNISGAYAGSIAGKAAKTGASIVNCFNKSNVSGQIIAGGIIGDLRNGMVANCWNVGKVTAKKAYGIVGGKAASVSDCYSNIQLVSEDYMGSLENSGIIGKGISFNKNFVDRLNKNIISAAMAIDYKQLVYWKWDNRVLFSKKHVELKDFIKFSGMGTKEDPYRPMTVSEMQTLIDLKSAGLAKKNETIYTIFNGDLITFDGSGTKSDPYKINGIKDLSLLRDLVNGGMDFNGKFFVQTDNIDMKGIQWTPIGNYSTECPFKGVYDGKGHYVTNLTITENSGFASGRNGFFGFIGGTIANFGIESGKIEGKLCGAIAAASSWEDPSAILNCYSRADVTGFRVSGIADFFPNGIVAGCWSTGTLYGDKEYGILSYNTNVKMYGCYTTAKNIAPSMINDKTSSILSKAKLDSEAFSNTMSKNAGLIQYLFANGRGVSLLQWQFDRNQISYGSGTSYLTFFGFINWYLLPLVLLILLVIYLIKFKRQGRGNIWRSSSGTIKAAAIICGIISLFMDMALVAKGFEHINVGNGLFILLVNGIAVASVIAILKCSNKQHIKARWAIPVAIVVMVVLVLEFLQFDLFPKYDAHLYYGSLVKATDIFNLDFLTYVGGFVCWKWAQGLALLIAPFEFLLHGQIIGVYIANMIISAVTIVCFYWLLRKVFVKISPVIAALSGAILMLCPYELGLFTYLCMDTHTAYFLVWLICSYYKRNDWMITFCGYLLAFNKITGIVFYAVFLVVVTVFELTREREIPFAKRFKQWWSLKKVVLWILPAVLYVASFIFGARLEIQNFFGTFSEATVGLKEPRGLANNFMQSFVYGFRWIFLIAFIVLLIMLISKRRKLTDTVTREGAGYLWASCLGCMAVLLLLCIYRGDAECPRYTALFNIFYALMFPIAVSVIFRKETLRIIICGVMTLLLAVQTYWTIDPSITLTSSSIDLGSKKIYKLALPGDKRVTMNLGVDYGPGYEVIGDLYTYNLEHTVYDTLIDDALSKLNPKKNAKFFVLDIVDYELHISGNQYNEYWDPELKRRTYEANKEGNILLNSESILSKDIMSKTKATIDLPDDFYLVVVARINETNTVEKLKLFGYDITSITREQNAYGRLTFYKFEKPEDTDNE